MQTQELKPGQLLKTLRPAHYAKIGGLANDLLAFVLSEDVANVLPGTLVKVIRPDRCPLWGTEIDGWWRIELPNGVQLLEHIKTLTQEGYFKTLLD